MPPLPPSCPIPPILEPDGPILLTSRGFAAEAEAAAAPEVVPFEPLSRDNVSFPFPVWVGAAEAFPERKALFNDIDFTAGGFLGGATFCAVGLSALLIDSVPLAPAGLSSRLSFNEESLGVFDSITTPLLLTAPSFAFDSSPGTTAAASTP